MSGAERGNGERKELCERCHHWLREMKQKVIQTAQGPKPVAALIAAGQLPKDAPVLEVAPCTVFPTWVQTPIGGWCGQYKPQASSNS